MTEPTTIATLFGKRFPTENSISELLDGLAIMTDTRRTVWAGRAEEWDRTRKAIHAEIKRRAGA